MIQLKAYELAVEFYRDTKAVRVPTFLKDQLQRAASSVVLNIAEGYGRRTPKDRRKFFYIALGSLREVQAIADIERELFTEHKAKLEHLAATVYKLANS